MGPPVIWPQLPDVPIYHNRGIWPFVTAYGLLAARRVGNDAVFDHDLESLVRGAALNLSNMENFEFLSQHPLVDDGPLSGPVVNSRRQLWSVAGYVGAIVRGLFGLEASQTGLRVRPFVTAQARRTWLAHTDRAVLRGLTYRGVRFDITLHLPPLDNALSNGVHTIVETRLDGVRIGEDFIGSAQIREGAHFEIVLGPLERQNAQLNVVDTPDDREAYFAPREPTVHGIALHDGRPVISFEGDGENGVVFNVYRDGVEVAEGLPAGAWTDVEAEPETQSHCYAVEAVFASSGNRSHHSPPICLWGANHHRVETIDIHNFRHVRGGYWGRTDDRPHYVDWGDPDHALELVGFQPRWSGRHGFQLVYANGAGPINSGVTAAVKSVRVEEVETGLVVMDGFVTMPHLGDWNRWGASTILAVELRADTLYRIQISDGLNMSYFAHFEPYTGGAGGGPTSANRVNITAARILSMGGPAREALDIPALDGRDDLATFAADQRIVPGVRLQAWERFGLRWDDDFIYLAVVSEAFEAPYRAFHLYLESASEALGVPRPGRGLEYSNLVPQLPFTPSHLITVRRQNDDAQGQGPWNGVFRQTADGWRRDARLVPETQYWVAQDHHTLSIRLPRALIGAPRQIRLSGHLVNGVPGEEWKLTVPARHTPWTPNEGGYLEIDLAGPATGDAWGSH